MFVHVSTLVFDNILVHVSTLLLLVMFVQFSELGSTIGSQNLKVFMLVFISFPDIFKKLFVERIISFKGIVISEPETVILAPADIFVLFIRDDNS